jgi:hypothetical protein
MKLAARICVSGCGSQFFGTSAVAVVISDGAVADNVEGEEAFVGIVNSGGGVLSSGAFATR